MTKKENNHRFAPSSKHEVKLWCEWTNSIQWYPCMQAVKLLVLPQFKTVNPDGSLDKSLYTAVKRIKQ